jgi:D-alanyl-lipoteichoic acid acyltransferase DltB (MBOAT superfamily)
MQFTSFQFAVFFPIVVLLYYVMPKRFRQVWLLLASYYFYMGWNAKYVLLILASTVITYLCGVLIDKTDARDMFRRKFYLVASLLLNFGILVFFKYFYFLRDTIAGIVSLFGIKMGASRLDILLPVGISFYTFQALGYTIDVYRGDVRAERNFIRYALFVSFFPQLVAGPIERSKNLLSQIERISHEKSWDFDSVTSGLLMMLWGFFMKMVIADRAAVLVNQVYGIYYMFNGVALTIAAVFFAIQIYCDFASYSAIAVGAAKVLGIELMANFKAPLFSRSTAELWRRWHVSLSSWFRDYLYIPLGGSRCGKLRKYFNNFITFAASGLWHGASWNFVVWGALQSVFIIIGDMTKPVKDKFVIKYNVRVKTFSYQFLQGVCTFCLFAVSLIFFRSETIKDAVYYIQRMFTTFDVWSLFDESVYYLGLDKKEMHVLIVGIIILVIVDAYYVLKNRFFDSLIKEQCLAVQYIMVAIILVMVVVFGVYGEGYDATQFIYFQF